MLPDGGVLGVILKFIGDYTPSFIGALLGSGWVQSRYAKMTRLERVGMWIFTMGCVSVSISALISFSVIWSFPFPTGLHMLAALITAIVCIPFAKWLSKNSESIFDRLSMRILPKSSDKEDVK